MNACLKNSIKGLLTLIPGGRAILPKQVTGGTNSAHYCYEVWMKHLTMLWENGMRSIPDTVAELGPGDSIGIGLAAMLSGANRYFALDVVEYSDTASNLRIFDELVELFRNRAAGPGNGWPDYSMHLDENRFPGHILTDELLEKTLSEKRLSLLRRAISRQDDTDQALAIRYMVPWSDRNVITENSVDAIVSHSVLEHVVDLPGTYKALYSWLKPGGFMSHQIDFTAHGLSEKWNGYRAYPELLWKIIVGKQTYLINREPYSTHLKLIQDNNFEIICNLKRYRQEAGIDRSRLSSHWKGISDDDLTCSGTFIHAKKPLQ